MAKVSVLITYEGDDKEIGQKIADNLAQLTTSLDCATSAALKFFKGLGDPESEMMQEYREFAKTVGIEVNVVPAPVIEMVSDAAPLTPADAVASAETK